MVELSVKKLNELIATIYDAALDPGQWQVFVEQLALWADGAQIIMHGHDFVANRPLVEVSTGLPPEFLDTYHQHFGATNVWVPGIARMQVGKAGVPEAFFERTSLFRTEYFNDWLQPMDIGTAAGVVLHRDSSRFLILSGNLRLKDEDRLRQPLLEMLNRLSPHITRAFAIGRRLAAGEGAQAYWRTAERSAHAVMLLNRHGGVIHANPRATALLGDPAVQARGLPGMVNFHDLAAQAALHAALDAIARNDLVRFDAQFTVRGRNLQTLAASVVLLGASQPQLGTIFGPLFDDIPLALLVLQAAAAPGAEFGAEYGLTPAERALATALARGQSMQAYATARQLSIYTVRTQLKAVFAKTNVHRQGELLALLMRSGPQSEQPGHG